MKFLRRFLWLNSSSIYISFSSSAVDAVVVVVPPNEAASQ
jgi:hypothetical protein